MRQSDLFGTSGIRGIVGKDLTEEFCQNVAQAIGVILPLCSRVCIATDTRVSREIIKEAVISGLLSSGIDVVDLGILPTPALAFLTREMEFDTGVMVTASHNPAEFNGIKLFNKTSLGYSNAQEEEIARVFQTKKFRTNPPGRRSTISSHESRERYFQFILDKFSGENFNRGLTLVVDPGNGAACGFATELLSRMGFEVVPINNEPDGSFPNRNPEPREDTLAGTVKFLRQKEADLGLCFDGDADRVVFCDKEGFLGFNEMIAFISRLMVEKTGKKRVASTVEAGRLLDLALKELGGEVARGKVGDVNVAYLAHELDTALGVEQAGVYILPEAGYYPDSIFASLILLSQLSEASEIRRYFQDMPKLFFEKSKVPCLNELKGLVMTQMQDKAHLFPATKINTLDGLRLEFGDSWMLIRASGTEPAIRVIAESISKSQTDELVNKGTRLVQSLVEASQ